MASSVKVGNSDLDSYYNKSLRYQLWENSFSRHVKKSDFSLVRVDIKPRDELQIVLEDEHQKLVELENQIGLFKNSHRNGEYRQVQENLFQVSNRLDNVDFQGRADLIERKRQLLRKSNTLTRDLASKIDHDYSNCAACIQPIKP